MRSAKLRGDTFFVISFNVYSRKNFSSKVFVNAEAFLSTSSTPFSLLPFGICLWAYG
jgi:hypothetical protein